MLHRSIFRFILAAIAALIMVTPVFAGGWAVVTLDELPGQVIAGQPIQTGFTVRQHGRTLRDDLVPIIRLERADKKDSFTVTAKRQGASGHYVATLTFPSAGTWDWKIDIEQFGMITQPMPQLSVLAAAPANDGRVAAASSPRAPATSLPAFLAALLRWFETARAANNASSAAPSGPAHLGRDLFLAKGCVMCHRHDAVREARQAIDYFEGIGPDLTHLKLDADYLRRWLNNPSAIKKGTQMPTLGLSGEEIEALIAFLGASE